MKPTATDQQVITGDSVPLSPPLGAAFNLQAAIAQLSLEEMQSLYEWLGTAIAERTAEKVLEQIPSKKGTEVVERRRVGRVTYRLEKIRCGKKKCKCRKGKLHGPYWYAYHWTGKKLSRKYVGKQLKLPEPES